MTKHDKPSDLLHGATPSGTPTATRIHIAPGRLNRTRGPTFDALLGSLDGELIVTNALDVEYAACRALKARGITGKMETWHVGSAVPAMHLPDICDAAGWTVRECPRQGLRLVNYQPWSKQAVFGGGAEIGEADGDEE
jgi:hypothetical protein